MASGISISGDTAAGQFYVPRAQAMLAGLVARARLAGVAVLRDAEIFDDTAYCYCICAGEVHRAVIVVNEDQPTKLESSTRATIPIAPDFYSGAVIFGTMEAGADGIERLESFWPTEDCARLFGLSGDRVATRKLAVEPYPPFQDELANTRGDLKFSQYTKLKPTMYSGTMRKVVQLLMGFGRQIGQKSLYDKTGRDQKPSARPTKYQRDVSQNGVQIRFDWRFYRTHGIYKANDGVLWLVEIGQRGILAMPLPMHASTKTPAFLEKVTQLEDSAAAMAIAEFGGFPTGEGIPGALESWVRAGVVIRMLPASGMSEFYEKQAYSTQMGWAFNDGGSSAHNTCWEYLDDGIQTGYHFAVVLLIGGLVEIDPAPNAQRLKSRFDRLVDKPAFQNRYGAVMAKIDRMTANQIEGYLNGDAEAAFEALDAITVEPQATGTAKLNLVASGRLMYAGKRQPHIKFPEPDLGYCLTHDMQPLKGFGANPPLCDTIVHVFFSGDELRYLKFFSDPVIKPQAPVESTLQPCMYQGEWYQRAKTGGAYIPAMVYSSDFDDREEITQSINETYITSSSIGVVSISVEDFLTAPYLGVTRRSKGFIRQTITTSSGGIFLAAVSAVPFYDRCAYYYTRANGVLNGSKIEIWGYETLGDPWVCNTWRNLIGFTGFLSAACIQSPNPSSCWTRAQHPNDCGPVEARTGMEPSPVYNDSAPCPDDADSGPWCGVCTNIDAMTFTTELPPLPPPKFTYTQNQMFVRTYLASSSAHTPKLLDFREESFESYGKPWFRGSPDPFDRTTLYVETTHNAFGAGDTMRAMRTGNSNILVFGKPQIVEMTVNPTTFVGVV